MNECRTIHETALRDLVDLIGYFDDLDTDDMLTHAKRSKFSSTSISKLSSNLILEFPVICSRNLSIEAMSMTAKAIERKCVVMLQLLFSAYQLTNADDAAEFIGRFHKNIKLADKITVDDVVYALDRFSETHDIKVDRKKVKAIQEDMKNIFFTVKEENFNPTPLSEFSISRNAIGEHKVFNEAIRSGRPTFRPSNNRNNSGLNLRDLKDRNERFAKQLQDTDIKKANEIVPSTLVINLVHKDEDGSTSTIDDILIGVKARMIPIDSDDIINHILCKVEDKNWLLQFIRATTREISFFKDFIFAIDRAKVDALAHSKRGSSNPMWKVLERRAIGSRFNRLVGRSNDVMAITTIVVSQEEVDYVRKEHNIDFESFSTIGSVMEAYNLMGMVILDESLEVAKFLWDTGDGNWENYSFNNLERENSDNSYKKIVNLMSKMAR